MLTLVQKKYVDDTLTVRVPTNFTKKYVDDELAKKVAKAGDTMSGDLNMGHRKVINATIDTSDNTCLANIKYVDDKVGDCLPLSGGTMTGDINMSGGSRIRNMLYPSDNKDACTKYYCDSTKVSFARGGTISGNIDMNGNKVTGLETPTGGTDAANNTYADSKVAKSGGTITGDLSLGSNTLTSSKIRAGSQRISWHDSYSNDMYKQLILMHPFNDKCEWVIGHQKVLPTSSDSDLVFGVVKVGSPNTLTICGLIYKRKS